MQISDRSRRRALQKLEAEGHKSIDIMLCSAMIAMYRYYGYRGWRLGKIMQETQAAWNECANDNNVSMLMMLERETGIELRLEGCEKSYHDLIYLNGTPAEAINLTPEQWYYMRVEQCKWMSVQVLGSLFLSLHRTYDFGGKRLEKLLGQIYEVKAEFNNDPKRIRKYCEDLTHLDMERYTTKRA